MSAVLVDGHAVDRSVCIEKSPCNYGSFTSKEELNQKEEEELEGGIRIEKDETVEESRGRSSLDKERELLVDELKGMTNLALPVVATYLLEMLPGIVTIVLVGRMDYEDEDDSSGNLTSKRKLYMDAAALANMFFNFVGLSVSFGLLTALDTLCSQAHGAKEHSKMGTYCLTGLLVVAVVFVLVFFLLLHAPALLKALGQPPEVSDLAGLFCMQLLPGTPFIYIYEIIKKIFQAKNEAMPMALAALVGNLVNCCLGYYLVHSTALGWLGAATARTIGNISMLPAVLFAAHISSNNNNNNHHQPSYLSQIWQGCIPSQSFTLQSITQFLQLGVPGMLQVVFEWWAFEAIALLCGILPGIQAIIAIGANAIVLNVASMTYMFYLGISISGNVRIGNALGAGDVHRAQMASYLVMGMAILMSIINIVFLLSFSAVLPTFFSTDIDINKEAQRLLCVAAVFQIPDSLNGSVQGIFRGSGRQALAAKLNFIAYYVIGIPLAYFIGIRLQWGVEGLWWSMTMGLFVIAISGTTFVLKSDWNQLSLDARKRIK